MAESEDASWSDDSENMEVDYYSDTTSIESNTRDDDDEEQSSAQSPNEQPYRPRSPIRIRSPRQRGPEVYFYTVSEDSIDSAESVTYQVADLNRFEVGYVQPFPLNLHRSGGYRETNSAVPSESFQEETQQPTRSLENQSPRHVPNQSPPREYVQPIENTLQPTTSKETSENTMNDSRNEDTSACPICLDDFTNAGPHKPACLKCGHIFGESCLQRWIKVGCNSDARRCPTCNTKASLKDIRVLYAKKLIAVDTVELSNVQNKLKRQQIENDVLKTELENEKAKNGPLREEVKRLRSDIEKIKAGVPSSSIGPTSIRQCVKKIKIQGTNPNCRVMGFNRNNMLLVVSQVGEGPFVNSHGIRKLNALVLETTKEYIYAHKKQIRDMSFHPIDHNQLATVGLDKYVCLTDLSSNSVVSAVEVDEPLWSCCWTGNNTNMLVAGSQMGSLFYFDRRFMKLLHADINRKPACVSLSPIPSSTSRSFSKGGFLKTRMDVLSIFEHDIAHEVFNYKENQLSLKGKWSSSAYDIQSNLLLTSAKPCGTNQSIRHIISKISNLDEEGPTIQPVVTFYGGDMATQLTRSCFVPSNDNHEDVLVCGFDEKSKKIKIFSVNSNKNVHNFSVNEKFTDLCPLNGVSMNGRRTVAALSECGVSIFSV